MGPKAQAKAGLDALTGKVEKMRAELQAYEGALTEAGEAYDAMDEDVPEPDPAEHGLTVGGEGAAHNPTVMVRNNVGGA